MSNASFNKVIFLGNLAADPHVSFKNDYSAVCEFRLGIRSDIKYKGPDTYSHNDLFIPVVVYGALALSCGERLQKGSQVLVEGSLDPRHGPRTNQVEVMARTVKFMARLKEPVEATP